MENRRVIDQFDVAILRALQEDGALTQRQLSQRVNLSANACWHRIKALKKRQIIVGQTTRLDRIKINLGLVVFVMVRTRHHSAEWLDQFRKHVSAIPNVIDFYRIGGDYDYLLKIAARDMTAYDLIYQRLISAVELNSVTSYFAMEAIAEQRALPIDAAGEIA